LVCHLAQRGRALSCCTRHGCVPVLQQPDPPFGPSRVLVRSHHRAVDEVQAPVNITRRVGLSLQLGQDTGPHAGPLPVVEAAGDRLPRAVVLGQGAPGTPRAQDPEDAVEDGAVVLGRTAGTGLVRRQQWTQPLSLHVGQFACLHVTRPRHLVVDTGG
jgi:hypothetical protein